MSVSYCSRHSRFSANPRRNAVTADKSDHRHRRLLRARRERPRDRRAAECGQQFPPSDGDCHTPLPREVRKWNVCQRASPSSEKCPCYLAFCGVALFGPGPNNGKAGQVATPVSARHPATGALLSPSVIAALTGRADAAPGHDCVSNHTEF